MGWKTSRIVSHSVIAGIPSIRNAVSRAMTSASVLLCETAVCFLQIHEMGTKVLGPTSASITPVVDFVSLKSPAKLASVKSASQQSLASSPTKQTWHQSFVC